MSNMVTWNLGGGTRVLKYATRALYWLEKETGKNWTDVAASAERLPFSAVVLLIRAGFIHGGKVPEEDTVCDYIDALPNDGEGGLPKLMEAITDALVSNLPPADQLKIRNARNAKTGAAQTTAPLAPPTGTPSASPVSEVDATLSDSGT